MPDKIKTVIFSVGLGLGLTVRRYEETLWEDVNALCVDGVGTAQDFVYICQHSVNVLLRSMCFLVCKFYV